MKPKFIIKNSPKMPVNRGFAVLLILLGLMIVGGVIVLKAINGDPTALARQQVDTDILARAKLALLTKALFARRIPTDLRDLGDAARPGAFALPDYLAGNTPTSSTANGQYDGRSSEMGCQDATKPNGLPRIGANNGGITPRPNIRCLGRFPWADLGLDVSLNKDFAHKDNQHDPLGEAPWYAVSANLIDPTCYRKLNSETLAASVEPASCSDTHPVHEWLTVHDETGKIISGKVAAVILLPGPQINGQVRTKWPTLGTATQYLEGITVNDLGGCASLPGSPAAPCEINNSGLTNHFIQGAAYEYDLLGKRIVSKSFNDRLVYITVDELSEQLQKRVATQMRLALTDYASMPQNNGKYPWLAPVAGAVNGGAALATPSTLQGRMPHMADEQSVPSDFIWNVTIGGTETTDPCVRVDSSTWVRNPLRNTFALPLASPLDPLLNFRTGNTGSTGTCTWKNGVLVNAITILNCTHTSADAAVGLPGVASYATNSHCLAATPSNGVANLSIKRSVKVVVTIDGAPGSQCPSANFSPIVTPASGSDVARLKGMCTSGTVAGMVTVTDKYQTGLKPTVLLESLGANAEFEITNMRLSPVMPSWFGENDWHTQSFVFYAATQAPVSVTDPCAPNGIAVGALTGQKAAIVVAGKPNSAQIKPRPANAFTDYFEGLHANASPCTFSAANTTHTPAYNDTVQAISP